MPNATHSSRAATSNRLYWILQAAGWSLYAGLGTAMLSLYTRLNGYILSVEVCVAIVLLFSSHVFRLFLRHQEWRHLPLGALLWRLALAQGIVALVGQAVLYVVVVVVVRPPASVGGPARMPQFVGYVLQTYFVLWLWSALYFGWHYLSGYRQAEIDKWKLAAAVREAEMRTLKAQINPHFMFNGLNNIRALVMEDPSRARQMITHLSDLLRYSIQLNSTEQVPLARELEIVEHYLELEAVQLEERLTYSLDVDPTALQTLIPPMTLQLLVENAIKHGIAPRPEGGSIVLTAHADLGAHLLQIMVRNTGHYAPVPGHEGVGLRNAQERLQLLYGSQAQLSIQNDPAAPGTVLAQVRLPLATHPNATPVASTSSLSSTYPFPTA